MRGVRAGDGKNRGDSPWRCHWIYKVDEQEIEFGIAECNDTFYAARRDIARFNNKRIGRRVCSAVFDSFAGSPKCNLEEYRGGRFADAALR
jgi:hypothetical protein